MHSINAIFFAPIAAAAVILAQLAGIETSMPFYVMVASAGGLSFVTGAVASLRFRSEAEPWTPLVWGANMAMLAVAIAYFSWPWCLDSPSRAFSVVGGTGIISFGGPSSIDWALRVVRSVGRYAVDKWLGKIGVIPDDDDGADS